jgi:hypothetical protein
VIDGGWNLNELHAVSVSLEEIFLQLTASPGEDAIQEAAIAAPEPVGEQK